MRGWGEEGWSLSPCLEHVCCGALSLVSEAPLPVSPYHQVNNTCLLTFWGMMDAKIQPKSTKICISFQEVLRTTEVLLWAPSRLQAQCLAQEF